jgi:hypothetical protein
MIIKSSIVSSDYRGSNERRSWDRRTFLGSALASVSYLTGARAFASPEFPTRSEQRAMYDKALSIAVAKVRGGPDEPFYRQRFVDAAFSAHIFLWDTCFIAPYAKYHVDRLPILGALDNFYTLQDSDGYICREYDRNGQPFWPKDHPVSINPPLLAFAELEVFGKTGDRARLARVFPSLLQNFDFLVDRYRMPDGLFFSDAFGSGMDNIKRYPEGWQDDGKGIALHQLHPDIFDYNGLSPKWNRQGRSVDFSAQMVLLARQLMQISRLIGKTERDKRLAAFASETSAAINAHCWSDADGSYYDLGYGQQIKRAHIGMFWTLWAGVVPRRRQERLIANLTDPARFWRTVPVATMPADSSDFEPTGGYWRGAVWAPTNYMVLRGLEACGRHDLAHRLARAYYSAVADVYRRTGTFWENYAPDSPAPGDPAKPDFCGWSAIAPIALWHEYIK